MYVLRFTLVLCIFLNVFLADPIMAALGYNGNAERPLTSVTLVGAIIITLDLLQFIHIKGQHIAY